MTLTDPQRQNLTRLADHLAALPEDYSHFDMEDFFYDEEGELLASEVAFANKPTETLLGHCGTAACALGHGPLAGIKPTEMDLCPEGSIIWGSYQRHFVPSYPTNLWSFLFGGHWAHIDNTPHGAAARIRYVLDDQPIPVEFFDPSLYESYVK